MRKSPGRSPARSRAEMSLTSSRRNLNTITSNSSSHKNLATPNKELSLLESRLTQQEIKQEKLQYKKFCNKVEIMTKKGFLEFFRLEDLDGTLLADRLYACFSPTGSIDFFKFIRGVEVLKFGSIEEKIQFWFTLFDIKKNGIIEKSDMKKVLLSLLNAMLEVEIDTDNEEIITLQQDVREMTVQEREESIEIILEDYGSMITYDEFTEFTLSNPILSKVLE